MRTLSKLQLRFRALFRRARVEDDLRGELEFHLEQETRRKLERGMSRGEARQAAVRTAGGLEQIKEECRDARGLGLLEDCAGDLAHGVRLMRRNPAFTLAAVLSLALGIGANTAIFSVVRAVLLKPLPYSEPGRLALAFESSRRFLARGNATLLMFRAWQERNRSFTEIAALARRPFLLTGVDDAEELEGGLVTPEFFPLLGVRPYRGRFFTACDNQPGSDRVAVISYGVWQRHFGRDPRLVGRTVLLKGEPFTIIGITPPDFRFSLPAMPPFVPEGAGEVWAPLSLDIPSPRQIDNKWYLQTIGRLKPGVSVAQAQADLNSIAQAVTNGQSMAEVSGLNEETVHGVRRLLLVLLGAAGFVLLIACTNVAHLQMARAASRRRELAIRAATGASRARIVRQLLAESLALAAAGGAAGFALAWWFLDLLVKLGGKDLPRAGEIGIDGTVLAFTLAISLAAGLLFGLAPALQASRTDLNTALKEGIPPAGPRRRWRGLLVAGEIAAALVLLAGASLMLNSLSRLLRTNLGYRTADILTLRIKGNSKGRAEFTRRLLDRVQALPGVEAAGATNSVPMGGSLDFMGFTAEGLPRYQGGRFPAPQYRVATPGYFRAMGIPLRRGRLFTERDREGAPAVAIVNETIERSYFGGNAIGRRVSIGEGWIEIVGVVGDVRHEGHAAAPLPEMYYPLYQQRIDDLWLAVKSSGDPAKLATTIRGEAKALDPNAPVSDIMTMQKRRLQSLGTSRFLIFLLGVFASIALALAAAGAYGVMNYTAAQRAHEMGVRMALGASRAGVIWIVMRSALRQVALGAAVGLPLAVFAGRLLSAFLYELKPSDPATLAAALAAVAAISTVAAYLPARRASRLDPLAALRRE
jgi:predicted permease